MRPDEITAEMIKRIERLRRNIALAPKRAIVSIDRMATRLSVFVRLWVILTSFLSVLALGWLSEWEDPTIALEACALGITGLAVLAAMWLFWRRDSINDLRASTWRWILKRSWRRLVSWTQGSEG